MPHRLSMDEEKLIADAVLEFQDNGTPLSQAAILNLAMTFIKPFRLTPAVYWISKMTDPETFVGTGTKTVLIFPE